MTALNLVDHLVDYFDAISESYDGWAGRLRPKVAARLVEWAAPRRGEVCLDVGTGTGLVARGLARRVGARGHVIGIDLSEGMLSVARRKAAANTRLVGMAAEDLVFRDETFDLVTCGDSLPYLVDPVRSLAEARRVLRPGGRIALSCQRRSLDTEAQETFFECLNALVARHPMRVPTHSSERVGFGEPEELTAMLAEAGFAEPRLTAMVTGGRVRSGASWIALMEDAGPFAHALIRTLGPALREQLARDLEEAMAPLGEEAFHYHFPFTFAVAERWG